MSRVLLLFVDWTLRNARCHEAQGAPQDPGGYQHYYIDYVQARQCRGMTEAGSPRRRTAPH
jgi:hypothetical protein